MWIPVSPYRLGASIPLGAADPPKQLLLKVPLWAQKYDTLVGGEG